MAICRFASKLLSTGWLASSTPPTGYMLHFARFNPIAGTLE